MRTNKNPITTQVDKETESEKDFFGNKQADRALFGVRKKLTTNLSVECHVSELINDATDPSHLRYFKVSNVKPNVPRMDAVDVTNSIIIHKISCLNCIFFFCLTMLQHLI
jgi:hypothetical protein